MRTELIAKESGLLPELILNNLLNNTPEHIYWKDRDGVYLGCNDKQAKSLGFKSGKEVIGKTDFELPWAEISAEEFRKNDLQVINTGIAQTIEETIIVNGKTTTVFSLKAPIKDADGIIHGVLGISIDITDRKRAEEREKIAVAKMAEEKAHADAETELRRAVTVLAGSIAHDLRMPLTSMSLFIDLFKKTWVSIANKIIPKDTQALEQAELDKTQLHLEQIDKFTAKMKKVIHEMNEFINVTLKSMQRLVAGTLSYEDLVTCEVEPCLLEVLEKFPFQPGEKSLIYLHNIHNFSFLGYPVLFYRIIFNLISNSLQQISIKKKGEIFITTDSDTNYNILRIKDTAGGASAEVVESLFDGYKTTKKEGTGVGLAFCKLTMQSFDGDITCRSVDGDFIEFTLLFPKLDN